MGQGGNLSGWSKAIRDTWLAPNRRAVVLWPDLDEPSFDTTERFVGSTIDRVVVSEEAVAKFLIECARRTDGLFDLEDELVVLDEDRVVGGGDLLRER